MNIPNTNTFDLRPLGARPLMHHAFTVSAPHTEPPPVPVTGVNPGTGLRTFEPFTATSTPAKVVFVPALGASATAIALKFDKAVASPSVSAQRACSWCTSVPQV